MPIQLVFPGFSIVDGSGGFKSKGRAQLVAILQKMTGIEAARLVGCSGEFISLVAAGKRKPQRWALRIAFERALHIPCEAWDQVESFH